MSETKKTWKFDRSIINTIIPGKYYKLDAGSFKRLGENVDLIDGLNQQAVNIKGTIDWDYQNFIDLKDDRDEEYFKDKELHDALDGVLSGIDGLKIINTRLIDNNKQHAFTITYSAKYHKLYDKYNNHIAIHDKNKDNPEFIITNDYMNCLMDSYNDRSNPDSDFLGYIVDNVTYFSIIINYKGCISYTASSTLNEIIEYVKTNYNIRHLDGGEVGIKLDFIWDKENKTTTVTLDTVMYKEIKFNEITCEIL